MDRSTFERLVNEIRSISLDTLVERNFGENGYAKGEGASATHNFDEGGKFLRDGGTSAQAAWSYMVKHLIALRDRVNNDDFEDLDEIKERCRDIINYTCFIWCIAHERSESKQLNEALESALQEMKMQEALKRLEENAKDITNFFDGVIV